MVLAREAVDDAGLVERWSAVALNEAEIESLDEEGYFARVPAARGARACEPTVDGAMAVREEVLVGWATFKLADGDDDIPAFGGIRLASS